MKPILTAALLLTGTLFALSCSKDNKKETDGKQLTPTVANLHGDWQLYATKIGNGSPATEWTKATSKEVIMWTDSTTFYDPQGKKKDFYLTTPPGEDYGILKYYTPGGTDTVTMTVSVFENAVILGGTTCIEGCAYKYRRSSDSMHIQ
jgi:hypothetical protein